ncbi:GNAT family N-acetyltransferase [Paracoccus marcusii]|jgi:ribosomal protein S18 acetylase RimI-like enzyme|uniref:GNAT family N-acetyltransferase n=1 Tax=Paracoccus marcusii TaxID=59779 RepID=UPI001C3CFB60|nr:GNAT family N-acetyltransferase [Paracoccus marcusii]
MTLEIVIPETPTADHERAIGTVLRAHNERMGGPSNTQLIAVLLNDEAGATVGGLWGKTVYEWLFIGMLAVPAEQRSSGLGSALMDHAETIARSRGCIGIWLDTFEFQALGFYQKLGFEIFGQIDDHPMGHRRYFLQKRLKL